jgi:thioesterase domain-containing protein
MDSRLSHAAWQQKLATLWAEGIPQAALMGVEIRRLDDAGLELAAPLAPNRNHMGSAFGGSLQSIATLAGWGVTLLAAGEPGARHVVIRNAQMRFRAPVEGELVAWAAMPAPAATAAFRAGIAGRGHARLTVPVEIRGPDGRAAAGFVGEFVAYGDEGIG